MALFDDYDVIIQEHKVCYTSNILTKDAWDNFDYTGKNIFRTLKKEVRNQQSS